MLSFFITFADTSDVAILNKCGEDLSFLDVECLCQFSAAAGYTSKLVVKIVYEGDEYPEIIINIDEKSKGKTDFIEPLLREIVNNLSFKDKKSELWPRFVFLLGLISAYEYN